MCFKSISISLQTNKGTSRTKRAVRSEIRCSRRQSRIPANVLEKPKEKFRQKFWCRPKVGIFVANESNENKASTPTIRTATSTHDKREEAEKLKARRE
eukprot:jgi/Galph1/2888/GphlegSOOS_G1592.1